MPFLRLCNFALICSFLITVTASLSVDAKPADQFNKLGASVIEYFPPEDFNGEGTNWSIQQHENGMIFVANANGLYSFDGAKWRHHSKPGNEYIHQFIIDEKRIYIGVESDLGYFELNQQGDFDYTSLVPELDDQQRRFSAIINVYSFEQQAYFFAPQQIMVFHPQQGMKVITPTQRFGRSWLAGDRLYFVDGKDLKYIQNNEIHSIPAFKNEAFGRIGFVQKHQNGYIIATFTKGIYLFDDAELKTLMPSNHALAKSGMFNSVRINDNLLAVSTLRNGVLILSDSADVIYHLNTNNGLAVNTTLDVFLDRQQGLWLAQEGQLARAQLPFTLSLFTPKQHQLSNVAAFAKINNTLFAGAMNGVQSIHPDSTVKRLEKALISSNDIVNAKDKLVVSGSGACQLYDPAENEVLPFLDTAQCHDLFISKVNPDTLFMTTEKGLLYSIWNESTWFSPTWSTPELLLQKTRFASDMVEDVEGNVWVAANDNEIIRAYSQGDNWRHQQIDLGKVNPQPLIFQGKLVIATDSGLFHWNYESMSLAEPVEWFTDQFGDNAPPPHFMFEDSEQRLWMAFGEQSGYLTFIDGKVDRWETYPTTASGMKNLNAVYQEGEVVWLGFSNGITRYNPSFDRGSYSAVDSVFSKISEIKDKKLNTPIGLSIIESFTQTLSLPFENNSLRLYFSLTNYLQRQNNQFRYRLNENPWSQWNSENYVDVGQLNSGDYRISVEAKDPQGQIYSANALSVTIIPPWYLTPFAYLVYVILSMGVMISIAIFYAKARTRKYVTEQKRLEDIVAKRTLTIQQQADELKRMDEAKSRFFANISHEFRTPLTLAIGPLQTLVQQKRISDPQDQQYLRIALENSQQMLSLVGQILDINRLESGEMQLAVSELDSSELILSIIKRFELLAQKQEIAISAIGMGQPNIVWFDPDHLNKIVGNLLSNAIKFSPMESKIEVGIRDTDGTLMIWVKDTGHGIPLEERHQLFTRFYQGKHSTNSLQPGTGIGLSMVKELLELHQGSIKLDEGYTDGCLFYVVIKKDKTHYRKEHFADRPENSKGIESELQSVPILTEHSSQEDQPNVLVVDDNEDLRTFIRNTLSTNYNVVTASNGAEALRVVEENQPDFIVSDVMMPVMDGLTFAAKLKENADTAHIPLMLLTAKSTKRETVAGLQGGADDYLTKPFDSSELIARIAAHLEQKRNIAAAIYARFRQEKDNTDLSADNGPEYPSDSFEFKFKTLVSEQLASPDFDIESLSESLFLSRSSLFRKVKKSFGCSPNQYLKNTRLTLSLQMLQQSEASVSDVAYAVGFQSLSFFSRSFKAYFDVSPSEHHKIQ